MKRVNRIWITSLFMVCALLLFFGCEKEDTEIKKDPVITWANPADISYGTLLSNTQLNATADVPGTFVYTPAIGTKLNVGANQSLKVDFIPDASADYNSVSKTVKINVIASLSGSRLYLGQTPPGKTPVVFSPEMVSASFRKERVLAFSPDSSYIFFATGTWPNRVIMSMEYKNGKWTIPVTASFSTTQSTDEPIFSPDGKRVYYYAYLPGSSTNADIYYSELTNGTWGAPVSLGSTLNSADDEWHPCIVNDGSIYFIDSAGKIYRSQHNNGIYENRTVLPASINDGSAYGDPYVSPNESYIIFNSKRSGGFGGGDLYISFRKDDKTWTTPKNLGEPINTSADEQSGDISPDGKYMTFDRNDDIYWVSSSFVDSLRLLSIQ